MKGKIDRLGNLWIWRGDKYRPAKCPRVFVKEADSSVGCTDCGHWCALFGEPKTWAAGINIDMCEGRILFFGHDEFTDERER